MRIGVVLSGCGRPVLLSDLPAHRELIESSEAGLLLSLDDMASITEKVGQICPSSSDMGDKGRKFAEKCDWTLPVRIF